MYYVYILKNKKALHLNWWFSNWSPGFFSSKQNHSPLRVRGEQMSTSSKRKRECLLPFESCWEKWWKIEHVRGPKVQLVSLSNWRKVPSINYRCMPDSDFFVLCVTTLESWDKGFTVLVWPKGTYIFRWSPAQKIKSLLGDTSGCGIWGFPQLQ